MRTAGRIAAVASAPLLAALTLSACSAGSGSGSGSGDGRLSVVASTDVWGSVVATVGGDRVDVTSIITSASADPHSFEADARVKLALSRADLVVENGGGYDDFVGTLLDSLSSRPTTIDAVEVSGKQADDGADLNEHVWYDFPTVAKVADAVAAALANADAAGAADYRAGAAAFDARLSALEAQEAQIAAAHGGAGVAITEPVPLYLLQACGLVDRTPGAFSEAIEEGTDVPVTALNETVQLFTGREVALLVYNEQTTGPQTEQVLAAAQDAGVKIVPVTETLPAGTDYLAWMTANVQAVSSALGG